MALISLPTPFQDIVETFKPKHYDDPPKKSMDFLVNHYAGLFDAIGYVRDKIKQFGLVIGFMAHYHISNSKYMYNIESSEYQELYESELKDKRFRLPKGLILHGQCGTGKTFAAKIISKRFGFIFVDTHRCVVEEVMNRRRLWMAIFCVHPLPKVPMIGNMGSRWRNQMESRHGFESPSSEVQKSTEAY